MDGVFALAWTVGQVVSVIGLMLGLMLCIRYWHLREPIPLAVSTEQPSNEADTAMKQVEIQRAA